MATTREIIIEALKGEMESEDRDFDMFEILRKTFAPFEGKVITKRMETALKAALPEHTVYYRHEYDMRHMLVWGGGIDYAHRMHFLMAYDSDPVYREEAFKDHSACYGSAARKRASVILKHLNRPDQIDAIVAAFEKIEAAQKAEKMLNDVYHSSLISNIKRSMKIK
jgi:hypothetical protein